MKGSQNGLRVVFVAAGYPSPEHPNDSVFTHRSVKALSARLTPTILHFRSWLPGRSFVKRSEWEGIPVVRVCCPQVWGGKWSHLNAKLLSSLGPALVGRYVRSAQYVHSTELYPLGFAVCQWAARAGLPCSAHAIGSDVNLFLARNARRLPGDWSRNLGGVACNSNAIRKEVLRLLPDLANVRVIYRGVDAAFFSPDGPATGPQQSLPPVRFIYLGGFHTYDPNNALYELKGGPLLLEAWRRVEAEISPSSLLITGPGTDPTRLQAWRSSLRRPEAAVVLPAVSPEQVPVLMRGSDVVVIPSLHEGLPNVANEAQCCGRPVLASDAGGLPESVLDGETGRTVPRGDAGALARALEWFQHHQDDAKRMGVRARERMCRDFSWERFADGMMVLFSETMQPHRDAPCGRARHFLAPHLWQESGRWKV